MNIPKNYRNPQTYSTVATQAFKLTEVAYLEACKPKDLRDQALIDGTFKHAKLLTKLLIDVGHWDKSVMSGG